MASLDLKPFLMQFCTKKIFFLRVYLFVFAHYSLSNNWEDRET